MIVNLRGTSGSGKSFVGRQLVANFENTPVFEPSFGRKVTAPLGYELPDGLFVMGRYRDFIGQGENRRPVVGGGVEGMGKPEYLLQLLKHFATVYEHIFFEGLTVSASLHKYSDAFNEIGKPHVIAYLDSTQQQCVDGVHHRNGGKDINEKAVFEHHDTVWSTKSRFEDLGHVTMWVPRRQSFETIVQVFADAGWMPGVRYLLEHGIPSDDINPEALEFERTRRRGSVRGARKAALAGEDAPATLDAPKTKEELARERAMKIAGIA